MGNKQIPEKEVGERDSDSAGLKLFKEFVPNSLRLLESAFKIW